MCVRDGPFDIPGGGVVLYLVNYFKTLFPWSYKGLQITQSLTCIKPVDLLLASSALNIVNINYCIVKIRKIHRNTADLHVLLAGNDQIRM